VLIKGEKTFFVHPGEELEKKKVFSVDILGEEEAILL
jgi:hypothetical protein